MKQRVIKTKNQKKKSTHGNLIYIQLDSKCSCTNNDATIQFTRRYLQCSNLMPIRIIRLFIGMILPHSPSIQISIFDCNNRLLKDSDRLYTLKHRYSSTKTLVLHFTLFNTITSLPNCSCLSATTVDEQQQQLSLSPKMIQSESIEQVLSTLSCASSTECEPDPTLVELITSEYGEICLPDCDSISQENLPLYPLDLSLKSKCPSSRIFPLMSIS